MTKFHISPDGNARACTAQAGACKYGNDTPHFSTEQDARTAFEASQSGSFSSTTLMSKAAKHEDTFTFQGAELDSKVWTFDDGSERWAGGASVSLTADGYHYTPKHSWGKWQAEILKEDRNGWTGIKGTKSFNTFQELSNHIENRAVKRAQVVMKNLDATHEEALAHIKDEKLRYDDLGANDEL